MSSSMDTLDVSQAAELKLACRRAGVTPAHLKMLCESNRLAEVRRWLSGELVLVPAEPKKLLELLATVSVAAIARFVAAENFVINITGDVRIAWLGENFKRNFLGKVEDLCEATELKFHKLLARARDLSKYNEPGIIPELDGREETPLGQFFALLAKQGKGQRGELLTNGYANFAYIRDVNDVLRAVCAYWYAGRGGWCVESLSVEYPHRWSAGNQVLSR